MGTPCVPGSRSFHRSCAFGAVDSSDVETSEENLGPRLPVAIGKGAPMQYILYHIYYILYTTYYTMFGWLQRGGVG